MLEVRHKMVDIECDAMLIHHAKLSNVQITTIGEAYRKGLSLTCK